MNQTLGPQAHEYDVAIAGANLGGLVAGAILAKQGKRVIVVDAAPRVGGTAAAAPHDGYWIDGANREGSDIADLQFGWRYGQLACEEADVEVPLRLAGPMLRIHQLPGASGHADARSNIGNWGAGGFLKMATEVFGCPPDLVRELTGLIGKWAKSTAAEREVAGPILVKEWLDENVAQAELRGAVLTMLTVIYSEFPERASLGRLMEFFAPRPDLPKTQPAYADHPEVGGMAGLMKPWADAIESRGGLIWLDHKPIEVTFDGNRATGLVVLGNNNIVTEIRAAATVVAFPIWQSLRLLPSALVPEKTQTMARQLEDEQADGVALQFGLKGIPIVRETGLPEEFDGWNRVLVGPGKFYSGGWYLPSLVSQRSAPEGKHLLHLFIARWQKADERRPFAEGRERLERVREYLAHFYNGFENQVEWSQYQLVERPACLAWKWAGLPRHGVTLDSLSALFLAGSTIESDAGSIDVGADAGMRAARAVLETLNRS